MNQYNKYKEFGKPKIHIKVELNYFGLVDIVDVNS